MATVQTAPELSLPQLVPKEHQADFLSLTMAALRLVNPWQNPSPKEDESPKERVITLNEVALHDSPHDCWVVIYDRVYDLSSFLDEHPGGGDILLEYGGRDASIAFRGSGHSKSAVRALDRLLVGELPMHERIYRVQGGIKLSDMPE